MEILSFSSWTTQEKLSKNSLRRIERESTGFQRPGPRPVRGGAATGCGL
jgi:hypothetical protein